MNLNYLNQLRLQEIQDILIKHGDSFCNKAILEIGGGTGIQATEIKKVASKVVSLEIKETNYLEHVPEHVKFYDGYHIPFPDNYFDTIFSSNVLEHVAHRDEFQKEIMRVLKPGGYALHVMPTHWWRLRDMIQNFALFIPRVFVYSLRLVGGKQIPKLSFLAFILGERHGEFGGVVTEVYHFMPSTWLRHFVKAGWKVEGGYPGGLFYTDRLLLGPRLPWGIRRFLAKVFGSSCYVYLLKKKEADSAEVHTL